MIRCIAIDDEPLALEQIKRYIQRLPELELVGTSLSASKALELMRDEKVDLLFLDIEMPDMTGMELARKLNGELPYVIFVTAYPNYAVEGFRVDAVDYLLKPLSFAALAEAVDRVKRRLHTQHEARCQAATDLYVKSDGGVRRIPLDDILYIKGLAEYVQIAVADSQRPVTTLMSMKRLEGLLPADRFMRVHRSWIVNISRLQHISSTEVTIGSTTIPVSDTYRKAVSAFCNQQLDNNHQ